MSNLFKQYHVAEHQKGVRVIDNNSVVEQKLAELVKLQNRENEPKEAGFRSLNPSAAEQPKEEDPKEAARRMRAEAEEALSAAREEAASILAQAQAESEEIFAQAREAGRKEGYDAGFSKIKDELEEEYERRKEELEQFQLELQGSYNQEMQELEPKLLDAILTVVEKVFHIQWKDKKEILLCLINQTITHAEGCRNFRIRVSEEQKSFLESHKEEILDHIGHDMSVEIVLDPSIEGSECVIDTEAGMFDCGPKVQLGNLIKDLKSLCS